MLPASGVSIAAAKEAIGIPDRLPILEGAMCNAIQTKTVRIECFLQKMT